MEMSTDLISGIIHRQFLQIRKDTYGHIVHQKIVKAESGKKGMLEVTIELG